MSSMVHLSTISSSPERCNSKSLLHSAMMRSERVREQITTEACGFLRPGFAIKWRLKKDGNQWRSRKTFATCCNSSRRFSTLNSAAQQLQIQQIQLPLLDDLQLDLHVKQTELKMCKSSNHAQTFQDKEGRRQGRQHQLLQSSFYLTKRNASQRRSRENHEKSNGNKENSAIEEKFQDLVFLTRVSSTYRNFLLQLKLYRYDDLGCIRSTVFTISESMFSLLAQN